MAVDKKDIPTPEETDKDTEERLDEAAKEAAEEVAPSKGEEPEEADFDTTEDEEKEAAQPRSLKKGEYIEGLGRRKRSTARVRIYQETGKNTAAQGGVEINGKQAEEYFSERQLELALEPLERVAMADKIRLTVQVKGGGLTGQTEALRMGLSRALVELEPSFKGRLKRAGFLTRDPREKERKKPGLKKARRAPQFSKR